MSDDIKKKLGIQDTHQQMYDELFAEMVARAEKLAAKQWLKQNR